MLAAEGQRGVTSQPGWQQARGCWKRNGHAPNRLKVVWSLNHHPERERRGEGDGREGEATTPAAAAAAAALSELSVFLFHRAGTILNNPVKSRFFNH
jgi:hypothetical protein